MGKDVMLDQLCENGVIAVIRSADPKSIVKVARALSLGGIKGFEITVDAPGAVRMIEEVSDALAGEVLVGAGTVLDAETARTVLLAGARYIFTPTVSEAVITICNRYGAPVIPGATTPTEILRAYEAGADMVKLFPAAALGAEYLKQIRGPLGHIPLVATGGINLRNVQAFIRAGARAVGAGSSLVDKRAIQAGNFDALTRMAEKWVEAVAEARG